MVGEVEDLRRAPVVRLQPEDPRLGIPLGEFEDVPEVGAPEAVDRLGVITHDGHVPVDQAHEIDYLGLNPVRVLVLVHEDMGKDRGVMLPQGFVLAQYSVPVVEEVIEIHGVGGPLLLRRSPSG